MNLGCTELDGFAYRDIPVWLSDRPDLAVRTGPLLGRPVRWPRSPLFADVDPGQHLGRRFDEGIYDDEVIDRSDRTVRTPVKIETPRQLADLRRRSPSTSPTSCCPTCPAAASRSSSACSTRASTDEAWALLDSEDLEDTWLRYITTRKSSDLARNRSSAHAGADRRRLVARGRRGIRGGQTPGRDPVGSALARLAAAFGVRGAGGPVRRTLLGR